MGIGSSLSIAGVFALIALAVAGGELIIVPIAVFAAIAAVVWFIVFRAMGVERWRQDGSTTGPELHRRSSLDVERELQVDWLGHGELPGGAEGGDESPSANRIVLPARDGTPWGDTDQHSSSLRMPVAHS